jgi:hypothetical protein
VTDSPRPGSDVDGAPQYRVRVLDIIRLLVELFAVGSLVFWGIVSFPLPWNILAAIAAPAAAILVWGLFVSPRSVVRVHPFVRAGIELIVFVSVTAAWWSLGQIWVGLVFAVVAVVSGVLAGRESLR